MTKAVIYNYEFEPITVIELTRVAQSYLEKNGNVTLAIPVELKFTPSYEHNIIETFPKVTLFAEKLVYRKNEHMMLFVNDEVTALLLPSTFLAGQTKRLNQEKSDAFARGFLKALTQIGL